MTRVRLHTLETAPATSRPVLQHVIDASPGVGGVINLWAAMAESSLTLDAYMTLREVIGREATLDAKVRSAVALSVGHAIGGRYSQAINSRIATRAGWRPDEIAAIRQGETPEPRLSALLALVREAARNVGTVSDATWAAALASGWTAGELIEGYTTVILTSFVDGFANFVELEVDEQLDPGRVVSPGTAA